MSTPINIGNGRPTHYHRESVSAAQPISMTATSNQNKPRRPSMASSMVTGMSWGGTSVGSWIRDDIIMQGTSPFAYQSPSFHSSSYQPKLEADFMRDFACCDLRLATLHDLLEHYEENHQEQLEELNRRTSEGPRPDPKAAIASNAAAALKDPKPQEPVGEMEMDDVQYPAPLNMAAVNNMQRTPTNTRFNPTVSSVNTPTLTTQPHLQQYYTPESSAPGTPGEIDPDMMNNMAQMNVYNYDWGYAPSNEMLDLCIDEPAKRLFQANGIYSQPQQTSSAQQLGDGQYGENSELARTIREEQKLAGVPDPSADGVPKPFHCPVIGCEKAYKNQNGLKYHKSHGHNTQTLHSNPNGTFSIVDPETLKPYPGTKGMEKHKPYQCQSCGKRYKNLNGLKYHKSHTNVCDPEIKGLGSGACSPVQGGSNRNSIVGMPTGDVIS